MSRGFQFGQDAVEQLEFARDTEEIGPVDHAFLVPERLSQTFFDLREEKRMVADLAQLHQLVHQGSSASFASLTLDGQRSILRHGVVQAALQCRQFAFDDVLDLFRELRFDFFLQPTEKKRTQDFVQTSNDQQGLLVIELDLFARQGGERRVEPIGERRRRLEDRRQDKIEQRPQFGQIVLERRAGEQQPVWRVAVVRVENLSEFTVVILHAVAFVDDHVLQRDLREDRSIAHDVLVGGEQNVEPVVANGLSEHLANVRQAFVLNDDDVRRPALKFRRPIGERREWHDDQRRARVLLQVDQMHDQGDGLNRLAEAHLVGENTVQIVVVQRHEPFEALQLVRFQLATDEHFRLLGDGLADAMGDGVVRLFGVVFVVLVRRGDLHGVANGLVVAGLIDDGHG